MTRYRVYLQTTAETIIEVEADDKEAAIDAALSAPMPTICAQCSGWGGRQNLSIGDDWDIDPKSELNQCVEEVTGS